MKLGTSCYSCLDFSLLNGMAGGNIARSNKKAQMSMDIGRFNGRLRASKGE